MGQVFKDGAVVQLKSGGPKMTVVRFDSIAGSHSEKAYLCRWFDGKGELKQDLFSPSELQAFEGLVFGVAWK